MKNPVISVVMPVYNAEKYLFESIQSILNQTFTDFEFIIIDDGSTDNSIQVIQSFNDERIIFFKNSTNQGNYCARNKGHRIAKGKYIAAMDADDISTCDRLEKQFKFMEENPYYGIVGSNIKFIGEDNIPFRENIEDLVKVTMLRGYYISHPSTIMRKEFLLNFNLEYNEHFWCAGDYDLICRGVRFFPVTNMSEVLLNYRLSPTQLTSSIQKYKHETDKIRLSLLENLKFIPTKEEEDIHISLMDYTITPNLKNKAEKWINKLLHHNLSARFYNQNYLNDFLYASLEVI